jgi:dimethylargininase
MYLNAIVRKPGSNFHQGITSAGLGEPSFDLIIQQHSIYIDNIRSLGLDVIMLDPLADCPDGYFVEDTAVITPEIAIITNPGAETRRAEIRSIEGTLSEFREIAHITAPGTLDGGDVLEVEDQFFIGISSRTNRFGANQLGDILEKQGYGWTPVEVKGGLHLKSFVNYIGENILVATNKYAGLEEFKPYKKIVLEPVESPAANSLWVNCHLLVPYGFPTAAEKLNETGIPIIQVDVSEAQKMDGGLTCMSLRF